MDNKLLTKQNGAQGGAEPLGMSSFSALLDQQLSPKFYVQTSSANVAAPFTHEEYGKMSMLLGCTGSIHQPVTQLQFVKLGLFIKACMEAQGNHLNMIAAHLCKHFTKVTPAQEVTMLQLDNEYPCKDDQLVSPKVIEDYTGYSDTTVLHKLSEAVQAGLITRYADPILDENGNEQLAKNGRVRTANPRYRWGDVKIIFGDRRVELLKARQKKQLEQARELQRKFSA